MQYSFWVKVFLQCSPCDLVHGNIAQIRSFIHKNSFLDGEDVMRILLTKSLEWNTFPIVWIYCSRLFPFFPLLSSSSHSSSSPCFLKCILILFQSDALLWELSTLLWITLFCNNFTHHSLELFWLFWWLKLNTILFNRVEFRNISLQPSSKNRYESESHFEMLSEISKTN